MDILFSTGGVVLQPADLAMTWPCRMMSDRKWNLPVKAISSCCVCLIVFG